MDWSTDEKSLEKIKQLSELQFLPDDIAMALDVPDDDLRVFKLACRNPDIGNGNIYKAYQQGRLEQEIKIRQAIFLAAKQGSPPAQNSAAKIILEAKLKERGR